MKKRGLLLSFILTLFLINFVSAQYFGSFSISNFLYGIDPSTVILLIVFIISFVVFNYSLSKFFKDNNAIARIISLALSFGIVYGLNLSGINYEGIFYGIGLSADLLVNIWWIVLIMGVLVLWWRLKAMGIALSGILLILIGVFTEIIEERGIVFIVGIVLLIVAFIFRKKKKHMV